MFAPGRVRRETLGRLSHTVDQLPTSTLRRTRRKVGAALSSGKLVLNKTFRWGAIRKESDLESVYAIAASLGELKGVSMKMGQILGYFDTGLPAEVRAALSVLHTRAQPLPFRLMREVILNELGRRGDELIARLDPEPIAVVSIGQVYRGFLPSGQAVAVKVQYPGIEKAIHADFGPAAAGAAFTSLIYPSARAQSFVEEARRRFLEECDYRMEARSQQRFHEIFAHHPTIVVPRVHTDYCSRRVLTTALSEGVHLEDYLALDPDQDSRDRAGTTLFEFYYGALFKFGIYNCDPHPGNYLFRPDGRLVMLDFGCTTEFEPGFVDRLGALTRAVHADDPALMLRAAREIGILDAGRVYDHETVRRVIAAVHGPAFSDEVAAITPDATRMSKRRVIKLGLPGEFLFLLRVRLGLLAVLGRLGARANWRLLERTLIDDRPVWGPSARHESFDVLLNDPGENEVKIIRAIRAATGLELKKVKALVDGAPRMVKQGLGRREAEALYETLQAAGASVEVREVPHPD